MSPTVAISGPSAAKASPNGRDNTNTTPASTSPVPSNADSKNARPPAPEVHVNGKPADSSIPRRPKSSAGSIPPETDGSGWGANFWVTLADPSTGVSFYACPATGEVSWDPPVGNFLLPQSPEGEWWEMVDEASGLPYYYHTKSGETVWERPQAFVIPLTVLQNTALARRLSLTNRTSLIQHTPPSPLDHSPNRPSYRRSRSYVNDREGSRSSTSSSLHPQPSVRRRSQSSTRSTPSTASYASPQPSPASSKSKSPKQVLRRSVSGERYSSQFGPVSPLSYQRGHPLAPIPGSPYATDTSPPPSPSSKRSASASSKADKEKPLPHVTPKATLKSKSSFPEDELSRSRSTKSSMEFIPYKSPQPQSLNAALEMIAQSQSSSSPARDGRGKGSPMAPKTGQGIGLGIDDHSTRKSFSLGRASAIGSTRPRVSVQPQAVPGKAHASATAPSSPIRGTRKASDSRVNGSVQPVSPFKQASSSAHSAGVKDSKGDSRLIGREISAPVFDAEATKNMTAVKMRNAGKPILVPLGGAPNNPSLRRPSLNDLTAKSADPSNAEIDMFFPRRRSSSLNTGTYPVLPDDLASDIQQFSESHFARHYFSTHRTGFIFRRKVPVEQMMVWQKAPLSSPLLQMNKVLHREAVRTFKSIQRIMGDKDRDRPVQNGSTTSLVASNALLEEERGLLAEGLTHGELRDEIYCQVMKQLSGNPNAESIFKGWQLLCVLLVTFPPSKNFEASLRSFLNQGTHQSEGRVDVMAKYCLRRLEYISHKGPRGKPPTLPEIEAASDAAFHPSIFGESLDGIFRLQERNYPHQKVPIILPFLADGILALGGTKSEGIFRVPGDGDLVSELKLRIDKGYYTLDGFDDPHVLASLLKLWLRELADPLVPDELYNDCVAQSNDPEACIKIVHRLPTINRRVVLFVISFLQLFLEDKVQSATKMTAPNLALVMAPNLLRCTSESMAVVFTNAQYEQAFVHSLLLHLRCEVVDSDYIPSHGRGAMPPPSPPSHLRKSKSVKAQYRSHG